MAFFKTSLCLLVLLVAFPCYSNAITLGDVTYNEGGAVVDSSSIRTALIQGVSLFLKNYPELVARNKNWFSTADLSAGGSQDREDGEMEYYFRLDLTVGDEEPSFRFDVDPRKLTPKDFSQAIRNLVIEMESFKITPQGSPILVRQFQVDAFQSDLSLGPLSPVTGIGAFPDGRLALGLGYSTTIVDPQLRVIQRVGTEQARSGIYTAHNIQISPSGTLIAVVPNSGDLVTYNPPSTESRMISTGIGNIESLTWLSDGSLVVKEGNVPRVMIWDGGIKRSLELSEFISIKESTFLASGPDATLYTLNPKRKFLSLYDKTGRRLSKVIPCLPEKYFKDIKGLRWLPDGTFLVQVNSILIRLNGEGDLIWSLALNSSIGDKILDWVYSEKEKSIYLILPGSKTVFQFLESNRFSTLPETIPPPNLQTKNLDYRFLEKHEVELKTSDLVLNSLTSLGDYYRSLGAEDYALSLYQSALRQNPGNPGLTKTFGELKYKQQLALAQSLDSQVRKTLQELGPESAKADYSRAMKAYEQAGALKPGDAIIIAARTSLARAMKESEEGLGNTIPLIQAQITDLAPIFPALLATYSRVSLGTLTLKNTTTKKVEQLKASFFIPRFMDFPSELSIPNSLLPGSEIQVPLKGLFNQEPLTVEEDIPIHAQVVIQCTQEGKVSVLNKTISGQVYRRTALTWDDTGKLAAFITPNEETLSRFSMGFLDAYSQVTKQAADFGLSGFSPRIQRANTLIVGLAQHRIQYLEDPQSPLTKVMGQSFAIDTVRFAPTTLLYHNGDCDDLTVLLSSALESTGIPTAILTTPGHVFLAFNTGLGIEKAWLFEGLGEIIKWQDQVWIPLESTVLSKGLTGSWAEASKLLKQWRGKPEFGFLPVASVRGTYPPVTFKSGSLNLDLPQTKDLNPVFQDGEKALWELFYEGNVKLNSSPMGETKAEVLRFNRLGMLHGSFGNFKGATESFTSALALKKDYFPAVINLANLSLIKGDSAQASLWLDRAKKLKPDSPIVLALTQKLGQISNSGIMAEKPTQLINTRAENESRSIEWAE